MIKIVGILTGRQKEPLLPINYHNDSTNKFAKPPKHLSHSEKILLNLKG